MVTSVCIDIACGESSEDDGQIGTVLVFKLVACILLSLTSGVRDGVQKDGKVGLPACQD